MTTDPALVPCLVQLRAEFNAIAPRRDKRSDGWIGDPAHAGRSSDHNPDETGNVPIRDADKINEVHGLDVDADLNVPGLTMWMVVARLVARCRAGSENRLRYIIWDRRIWSASAGWTTAGEPYDGDNPHTEHAHFSASYEPAREASKASWHLQEVVPVTAPTAAQNADAVASKDVDPSGGTYSLGGAIWTTLGRSAILNSLPTQLEDIRTELDARVQDVDDELDGLGASLAFLTAIIGTVTNEPGVDPNPFYDAARAAVAAELDARGITGPSA